MSEDIEYRISIPKKMHVLTTLSSLKRATEAFQFLYACIEDECFNAIAVPTEWMAQEGIVPSVLIGRYNYKTLSKEDLRIEKVYKACDGMRVDITDSIEKPLPQYSDRPYYEKTMPEFIFPGDMDVDELFLGWVDLAHNIKITKKNYTEYRGCNYIDMYKDSKKPFGVLTEKGERLEYTPHLYDELKKSNTKYYKVIDFKGKYEYTDTISKNFIKERMVKYWDGEPRNIKYKDGETYCVKINERRPYVFCDTIEEVEEIVNLFVKRKKIKFPLPTVETDTTISTHMEIGNYDFDIIKKVDKEKLDTIKSQLGDLFKEHEEE